MFAIDLLSIADYIKHRLSMDLFHFLKSKCAEPIFSNFLQHTFSLHLKAKMLVCKWLILYNVCTVIFVPKAHNHKFNPISIHYWLQSINKINLLLDAKHDEKELAFEGEKRGENIYSCCIIIENTLRIRYIGFLKLLQAGIWFYLLRQWGSKTK